MTQLRKPWRLGGRRIGNPTPAAFAFGSASDVDPGSLQLSGWVEPTSFDAISWIKPMAGTEYRVRLGSAGTPGPWLASQTVFVFGMQVQVRFEAARTPSTPIIRGVNIGGRFGAFTVTTKAFSAPDITSRAGLIDFLQNASGATATVAAGEYGQITSGDIGGQRNLQATPIALVAFDPDPANRPTLTGTGGIPTLWQRNWRGVTWSGFGFYHDEVGIGSDADSVGIVDIVDADYMTFSDNDFRGNPANAGNNTARGLNGVSGTPSNIGFILRRNKFSYLHRGAVLIDTVDLIAEYNLLVSITSDGLNPQGSVTNASIRNNLIRDFITAAGAHPDGIQLVTGTDKFIDGLTISGNMVSSLTAVIMQGINTSAGSTASGNQNIVVSGNKLLGVHTNAILSTANGGPGNLWENNECRKLAGTATSGTDAMNPSMRFDGSAGIYRNNIACGYVNATGMTDGGGNEALGNVSGTMTAAEIDAAVSGFLAENPDIPTW